MLIIESNQLRACIATQGAEMQHLQDKISGKEYLWQGDPTYWGGRSPILFPATGGLWNGEAHYQHQIYKIPKHGFVKQEKWEVVDQSPSSVTLRFSLAQKYAEIYPFTYEVEVCYRLEGRLLLADFCVRNLGNTTMYFQMGGHPGIALPDWKEEHEIDGYLRWEGVARDVARAGEQGCMEMTADAPALTPDHLQRFPLPKTAEGLTPLCVATFDHEALIVNDGIGGATVLDRMKQPIATVSSDAPVWLFWAPQHIHAPFVCCEPWYGMPDMQGFEGELEARPYIQHAAPQEEWKGGYQIMTY